MTGFQHMIRRARRRETVSRIIRFSAWGLLIALAAGVGLLLAERLAGAEVPWAVCPILAAIGAAGGAIRAYLTRPDAFSMAVYLDRALKLKDRIGTIEALEHLRAGTMHHDEAFAALLRRDAERVARGIDVRAVTPITLNRAWIGVALLGAALWLGVLYLPATAWVDNARTATRIAKLQNEQVLQQIEELTQTIQQTTAELPREEGLDEQTLQDLQALDRLAEQLSADSLQSEQELAATRDEAAAKLNELADRLAQQAQRDQIAAEELTRRFAGMNAMDRPEAPMSAQEFAEALRRGDFGRAARELEHLLQQRGSMSPDDRTAAASHLRELGDRIEQAAAVPDPDLQEQREQAAQSLRDQGLDEQSIDELLNRLSQTSPEQLPQELRERGIDEEIARRMAEDLHRLNQQQEIDQQVQRDARALSEALDCAAEQLEQPAQEPAAEQPNQQSPPQDQVPPAPPVPPSDQPSQSPPAQRDPAAQPPQSDQQQHSDQQQQQQPSGDQQQQPQPTGANEQQTPAQQQQQPGQQQNQSQPQSSQQPGDQLQSQSQPQPGNQQQSQQQQQQGTREGSGSQPQPGSQQSPQPGQQPTGQPMPQPQADQETPAASPSDSTSPHPSQPRDPSQSPDISQTQQHDPANQPSSHGQQRQSIASDQGQSDQQPQQPLTPTEALQRLAERNEKARDLQQSSERLREAARQLADNMTPEQRQRWAQQLQRERGQQPQGSAADQPNDNNIASRPQVAPDASRAEGATGRRIGEEAGRPMTDQPRSPMVGTTPDDLDLTGETADRIIAQWLSEQEQSELGPATQGSAAPPRVRRAQEIAERAVNESVVHKRYHQSIRRYFDRLNRTVERASQSPPMPANGEGAQP